MTELELQGAAARAAARKLAVAGTNEKNRALAAIADGLEARMDEILAALLALTPGSVTPLGLLNDAEHRVRLLIDRDVAAEPYVGCHPCVNTSSLRMRTQDMLERFLPAVHHAPIVVDLPDTPV